MTLDDSILGLRLRVIRRAQEAGVSTACREVGISRTVFYRWRKRLERYGADGLHPRRHHAQRGRPVQLAPEIERLILSVALSAGTWGCGRIAADLAREHQAVHTVGLLTERTRRALWRARHGRTRHVEAQQPGELVCLDTFYIGQLKGVGKVWQITACDAACSYGTAWLLPAFSAPAAAAFLRDILVPLYRRAGWPLQRVLTDGGGEFKGAFDEACRQLGIRHTRTQPRHAWTNGFVERLQGTILQEHWRVQFRRRYFTSRTALARSLAAFMRFYNDQRPHQGYRLRGQTPSAPFYGAAAVRR